MYRVAQNAAASAAAFAPRNGLLTVPRRPDSAARAEQPSYAYRGARRLLSSPCNETENQRGAAVPRAAAVDFERSKDTEDRHAEVTRLQNLADSLRRHSDFRAKVASLKSSPAVKEFVARASRVVHLLESLSAERAYAILCLPAIGQSHVLDALPKDEEELRCRLVQLADVLLEVDIFYSSLGGIAGYQAKCLELISRNHQSCEEDETCTDVKLHIPQGPNLDGADGRKTATVEAAKGLAALPHMAEIWPLGGAGDRLGLECEVTGRSVPTAMLPYCGRTLLEGLVRDLQARESLYYKMYGEQVTTPVVIMTSDAKDNNRMVVEMLESFDWFGRGRDSFRVIKQPLVPVLSASTGEWLVPEALAPMMKPGGHGAIWKLMFDEGVFAWLRGMSRQAALVRQISNPLAGTDATMLALTGTGYGDGRTFGFAACERTAGAAEGVDVLMERRLPRKHSRGHEYSYNVTNIEYTEFERLGLLPGDPRLDALPANTNVLYVNLQAAEAAVKAGVASGGGADLPGMVFNGKKTVSWTDAATGATRKEPAGRMECTMQNLVDSLAQRFSEPLPPHRHGQLNTFVVFNKRRRVTSSAKRKRVPGSNVISQTPDGSFRDLMLNAEEVLRRCGFTTPQVGSVEQYLKRGPGFIFLFHPGLGPLWDVIAQKLRGGALAPGSELVLEVAEAAIMDLRLSGSLLVQAECVHGRPESLGPGIGWGDVPSYRGQTLRYEDSGSEAIQYSDRTPDLSKASGMVVPINRKRSPAGGAQGDRDQATLRSPPAVDSAFNSQCARVRMSSVVVQNRGIDWSCPDNVYWRHKVERREQVRIILHGQAEFEAFNVTLKGSHTFEVPDGYKMVVTSAPSGAVRRSLYPLTGRQPSWEWQYFCIGGGNMQLHMVESDGVPIETLVAAEVASAEAELPFTYMI